MYVHVGTNRKAFDHMGQSPPPHTKKIFSNLFSQFPSTFIPVWFNI